jgi:hypothetical protein
MIHDKRERFHSECSTLDPNGFFRTINVPGGFVSVHRFAQETLSLFKINGC